MQPPVAKRIPHPHTLHGDVRPDDYYWLRERDNPDVIAYLEAENRYYQEMMKPIEGLTQRLYEAMVARIPEAEVNVPVQDGPYFYYTRQDKQLQYPVHARKRASSRADLDAVEEEVILDLNAIATEGAYLSVTVLRVSPDHTRLAYLENRDGSDRYTAFVKDLRSGTRLPDEIHNVFIYGSLEWDASGTYLFYTTLDETQRPYQVWRHRVGGGEADTLLYEERDTTFTLHLSKSRDGRYLFVHSDNKTTNEIRYLDAADPLGTLCVFAERRRGILYDLEHWNGHFLVLTNEDAPNFRLAACPVGETSQPVDLFPYDDARYLEEVYPFRDALLLAGRQDGLTQLWRFTAEDGLQQLAWAEPVYTVRVGDNRAYDTAEALIHFQSLLTPRTTYALNLQTGGRVALQVAPVSGPYDAAAYEQARWWATAADGTQIPLTAVYKAGLFDHGPAPLILYGYGSYGSNSDPHFDPLRLPLLDAGVAFVTAQVRGGSEMGRSWYEDGKFLNKRNTFTDFVDAAQFLIEQGFTTPDLLAGRGGSAGGLLMGAVANLAPHLFKVLVPAVPFVDVVTTMLDASIPLTSLEWDEWGNPADREYYFYMKSYSPYDNVEAKRYPHMLVTTGLNDPRVAYWEPAKWVARLRASKTDDNVVLLKTNMGAGHFGASGRLNRVRELAESYAFVLDKLGV
ncbi:MAG: S9 family peptidase [Alicyclobacillus sp.]|nr:S9 family peptidase [Alicyclobacillus sp.]